MLSVAALKHRTPAIVASRLSSHVSASSLVKRVGQAPRSCRSTSRRWFNTNSAEARRMGAAAGLAAAAAAATTATTVALCDSEPVNWKLTLGLSAAAAVMAGGVAAVVLGLSDADDESDETADSVGDGGGPILGCSVLPMPPRGPARTQRDDTNISSCIVLDNGFDTRVAWGVASAKGRRQYMEDEWCAGIIVPQVLDEEEAAAAAATEAEGGGGGDDDANSAAAGDGAAAGTDSTSTAATGKNTKAGDPLYVVGVFDGHGGKSCSHFASRNILSQVGKHLSRVSQLAAPKGAVESAIATLESQMTGRDALQCGTTAIVVALTHSGELVVANVGDSRAMLCSGSGCNGEASSGIDGVLEACAACALSIDHKPDGPEQKRVEAAGGKVGFDGCARVYLDAGPHKGRGGLAMSRALGDKFFKIAPYVTDEANPVVSAEPDFQTHQIDKNDSWCILASDGLWDVVTPQRVCDILGKNVEGHKNDPQVVAQELVKFALSQGSSDNVTVLALRFDHGTSSSSSSDSEDRDGVKRPPTGGAAAGTTEAERP